MNYNINNNFCSREEAKDIIDFCLQHGEPFSYKPTESWDCRRIYDDKFKKKIYYTKLSTTLIGKEILERDLKKLF